MKCALCNKIDVDPGFITKTKYSFAVVNLEKLKDFHVMVLPIRCVNQDDMSELTKEESHDLFLLMQNLIDSINKISEEKCIVFKNNINKSSQTHLHFHIIPTNVGIRDFFSIFEGVQKRIRASEDDLTKNKELIKKSLS